MSNVNNVTAGKPKIGGAISIAPKGTELPTDAVTALSEDFKNLGYVSDAGLVNSNSPSSTKVKAWGGDTVLNLQEEKPDDFKFSLIEVMNVDVLKFVYGANHVSGDLDTGLTVEATSDDAEEHVIVVDEIMRGSVLKRTVIPQGKITAMEDITHADNAPVGYGCTVSAMPDSNGKTHYEYLQTDPATT